MNKEERIKALLGKYLDGMTTAGDERELRRYFADSRRSVPEEWLPYKALFAYVDDEIRQTASRRMPKCRIVARICRLAMATAAAAALVAVVVTHGVEPQPNYAVIDGKVYTNQQTVNDEALEALQMVSTDYDDSFGALELMR